MCILGHTVSTQDWINFIACVGELAVAALVALRGLGGPLATTLMFVSVDFFVWNFAQLAYHRSGFVSWHLLDMVASPIASALAFDFLLRFMGRSREFRWVMFGVYLYQGGLAIVGGAGLVLAGRRATSRSPPVWSWAWLAGLPAGGAHPGLALRPPSPRGDPRGTQPNPAPSGRGDGHLAAGVDRGLGRSRLPGPPPRRGRHPLLDGDSDDRGAAVPALRPRAHPLERPFGHGAGQRGWDRLSHGVPPGGNQHGVAGPGDA